MAENKRYYFLQMPEDFFTSKRIKKLRKLAGGDTFTIIYLKMQLKAMNNNGCLEYEGLEENIAEEIAMEIDEDAENVKITLAFLQSCNLLEIRDNGDCYLPYAEVNVGSITASSLRSQKCRKKKSVARQHDCNTIATNCNGDIDIRDKSKDIFISKDINCRESSTLDSKTYEEVIDYLNQKTGKSFRCSTSKTQKSINARLKEGYSVDDFKKVIDNKVSEWKGTNMEKYLRPDTLFTPSHFESYLNQESKPTNNGNDALEDFLK